MFTGIIEEVGSIVGITRGARSSRLRISGKEVLSGTRIGDSISTSGVCLTVAHREGSCFEADIMAETLRRTKLGKLNIGSRVNLERAMSADGRFGGHIVSGHIDGIGIIRSIQKEENAVWLTIGADDRILRYIVEKGSVAIDGISLTVAAAEEKGFKVSLIPHTGRETTLLNERVGNPVNLECDIIGKYVEKLFAPADRKSGAKETITESFLIQNGF